MSKIGEDYGLDTTISLNWANKSRHFMLKSALGVPNPIIDSKKKQVASAKKIQIRERKEFLQMQG